MADVFISYKKTENTSKLAERIAKQLHRREITYWHMGLGSWGPYAGKITREIDSCKVFLLIFNEGCNKSADVLNEVSIASKQYPKITIVPFCIDKSEYSDDMRYYLSRFSFIEAVYPEESDERRDERAAEEKNRNGEEKKKERDTDSILNVQAVINLIDRILSEKVLELPQNPLIKPKSGACGRDVTYKLQAQGSLSILGSGNMWNFALAAHTPWWNERETILSVRIQRGVTSIGDSAFSNCVNLTSIYIPYGVTSIGWSAFEGCDSLTSLKIPNSVAHIEGGSFQNCVNLSECKIPDSVTSIGNWAFGNCTQLMNVMIPDSVTYIGGNAFDGCENLINVSLPIKLSKYVENAFSNVHVVTYRE